MEMLTKRQRQALEFIRAFISVNGYPPSFQEIADGLGVKSKNSAAAYVGYLEGKGYLTREPRNSRTIKLVG